MGKKGLIEVCHCVFSNVHTKKERPLGLAGSQTKKKDIISFNSCGKQHTKQIEQFQKLFHALVDQKKKPREWIKCNMLNKYSQKHNPHHCELAITICHFGKLLVKDNQLSSLIGRI